MKGFHLNSWQVYLDSNQGMAASKAAALPLGDRPAENMVRKERLELSHLAAPEPKSGASTNFATSATIPNNSLKKVLRDGGYDGIRTCDPIIMSDVL